MNGSDSESDQTWKHSFPALDAEIRQVIEKYNGAVFPKLNWSSPQVDFIDLPKSNCFS